MNSNRLLNLI